MRIEGFWASAHRIADRVDLGLLVGEIGSWQELEERGVPGLRKLGLAENWIQRWQTAPAVESAFQVLRPIDDGYPPQLRGLADTPPLLFVEGSVEVLARPSVAIVGTRKCSHYGASMATSLSRAAVEAGHVVVSGLAFGIDRRAHEATFGIGQTIAVLGSGLGFTSPRSHHGLRRRIVEEGGAVVSVWADRFEASRYTFPYRNRWIAGLAGRTVVVEAPQKSGALHTARHSKELCRPVWAVPGRVGDPNNAGCHALLIADQAKPIYAVAEFARELGAELADDWISKLEQGASLLEVSTLTGDSVKGLMERLQLMEALGELRRLPGNRYARSG